MAGLARGFALIERVVTKQFGISGWKGTCKLKTFLLNSKMGNLTTKLPGSSLLWPRSPACIWAACQAGAVPSAVRTPHQPPVCYWN